jgi:uncharacterized protein
MEKNFDLKRLNVKAFARDASHLEGQKAWQDFERLSDLAWGEASPAAGSTPVQWDIVGEMVPVAGGDAQIWLHLTAEVSLPMQCQRCMGPVLVDVHAQASFRFVADEATAEAEDDESEEDLLVLTPELDIWELMEDELIMAAPIVPKHELCPDEVPMSAVDEAFEEAMADRPNPFAALAQLKKKPQ